MTTTVDGFVITEEDTSQEEAALKMAASGIVDIHTFWTKIRAFTLPLNISPAGKSLMRCPCGIELMSRSCHTPFFPPRVETPFNTHETLYRPSETCPLGCIAI
jgi:hypothetical protein